MQNLYCQDEFLGSSWKVYKQGGINMRVYRLYLETEEIDGPKFVRVDVGETVGELKQELGLLLNTDPNSLRVVLEMQSYEPKYFKENDEIIEFDSKCLDHRIYAVQVIDKDTESEKKNINKLKKLIELYTNIISLDIFLPSTDEGTLESLSIPSLDLNQNIEKHDQPNDRGTNSPSLRVSPQPGNQGAMCGDGYDQSNSEDSSLSDSDRTLIGDAPADCMALSSNSASPADQHMASPSDPCQDTYNYDVMGRPGDEMYWDDSETQNDADKDDSQNFYFRVTMLRVSCPIVEDGANPNVKAKSNVDASSDEYRCKVLADKRLTLEMLKKHLEKILQVPSEYFKVFKHQHIEDEWTRLKDTLRSIKDGEKLTLKLGRVLKKGEQLCKIFYLKPDDMEPNNFLFEHIISKKQTVESVKKDIIQHAKKQNLLDIPLNRCRLREKSWKMPKKVHLDDQKFGDEIVLLSSYNFELYLQVLTEPETVTSNNQVVVFLRKYSPTELTLGPFQEAVLDLLTMDDLRTKVSELSKIPLENIDIANVKGNFPYDVHILEVQDFDWNPKVQSLDQWPLNIEDGCMFFYRDNRETLKELTPEERKSLRDSEDARLGYPSVRTTYSPGKERALKIYVLDSSTKLEDDVD